MRRKSRSMLISPGLSTIKGFFLWKSLRCFFFLVLFYTFSKFLKNFEKKILTKTLKKKFTYFYFLNFQFFWLQNSSNRTPECKRHLQTTLIDTDTPAMIANELAQFAFISPQDVDVMTMVIQVNSSEKKFEKKS